MTPQVMIALVGLVMSVIVALLTWGFATGNFTGTERTVLANLAKELSDHKIDCSRRFDDAGSETSKAWSYVQGLEVKIESRCIREFAPRELTDERFSRHNEAIDFIRTEQKTLRGDIGDLWKSVHDRRQA